MKFLFLPVCISDLLLPPPAPRALPPRRHAALLQARPGQPRDVRHHLLPRQERQGVLSPARGGRDRDLLLRRGGQVHAKVSERFLAILIGF